MSVYQTKVNAELSRVKTVISVLSTRIALVEMSNEFEEGYLEDLKALLLLYGENLTFWEQKVRVESKEVFNV